MPPHAVSTARVKGNHPNGTHKGPKRTLALRLHEDGIPTPLGRKRFSLKRPGALYPEILRELHYDATHPSRNPTTKGNWHNVPGYPTNIVAVHRTSQDFYAMDREGNVFYGVNDRRVRKKDAPDMSWKERPERLTKILSPAQSESFLENPPNYLPPLKNLKTRYAGEVDKQMHQIGLQRQKLPQEMLAKLTPLELHKRALFLERFHLVEKGIPQDPEAIINHVVETVVQEVEHDYQNEDIRPPRVLKKKD